jgi:signal peptidase II
MPESGMTPKLKHVFIVAAIVLVLDHLTKWLIVAYVPQGSEVTVINGIFDIVHGRNTGAAFGVMSAWDNAHKNWFFYAMGIVAGIFLFNYLKSVPESDKVSITALGFILGGALGNITDRMLRGSVVDFLSFHYYDRVASFSIFGQNWLFPLTWPAFNVADSAISTAVVILILKGLSAPVTDSKNQ